MSKIRVVLEAAKSVHPMAVHAYPSEKGKFKVHATGSKVTHVKKGDTVSSSDLDDLSDAGHKVKEVKRPLAEQKKTNEAETLDSWANKHEKAGRLVTKDKDKKVARYHAWDKDEKGSFTKHHSSFSLKEGKMGSGGHRTKDGTYVPFKSFEKAGDEVRAKRANAGRALADADKKTRANAKEEVEQVTEKLTPEAKSAVKQALGPRTPGNQMRKGSGTARTLISVLKTNKKNVVPNTK